MGYANDLVNAGYVGYRGWGDAEAAADFQATGGVGKIPGGGAGGGFNFNYEDELTKAYGELGTYYDRILKESQGDMNKALARLVEDYDRGLRYNAEDTQQRTQAATTQVQNNALARGLFQKSNYSPGTGMGIPDVNQQLALQPINEASQRYVEGQTIAKTRQEADTAEKQKRYEFDLEQQRRKEAADLAASREQRAYNRFASSLT